MGRRMSRCCAPVPAGLRIQQATSHTTTSHTTTTHTTTSHTTTSAQLKMQAAAIVVIALAGTVSISILGAVIWVNFVWKGFTPTTELIEMVEIGEEEMRREGIVA
jgi:hypothetical protein